MTLERASLHCKRQRQPTPHRQPAVVARPALLRPRASRARHRLTCFARPAAPAARRWQRRASSTLHGARRASSLPCNALRAGPQPLDVRAPRRWRIGGRACHSGSRPAIVLARGTAPGRRRDRLCPIAVAVCEHDRAEIVAAQRSDRSPRPPMAASSCAPEPVRPARPSKRSGTTPRGSARASDAIAHPPSNRRGGRSRAIPSRARESRRRPTSRDRIPSKPIVPSRPSSLPFSSLTAVVAVC
jgi:hypothetical protein